MRKIHKELQDRLEIPKASSGKFRCLAATKSCYFTPTGYCMSNLCQLDGTAVVK